MCQMMEVKVCVMVDRQNCHCLSSLTAYSCPFSTTHWSWTLDLSRASPTPYFVDLLFDEWAATGMLIITLVFTFACTFLKVCAGLVSSHFSECCCFVLMLIILYSYGTMGTHTHTCTEAVSSFLSLSLSFSFAL